METEKMIEIKHGSENMCDLLNQEQAELKKAMIEELAHTLYCKQDKFDLSNPFEVAKAVVEEGYRKVPEGAVVLPREEYNAWVNYYNDVGQQIRKETAMEYYKAMKEIIEKRTAWAGEFTVEGMLEENDNLAKKFGLEVEE